MTKRWLSGLPILMMIACLGACAPEQAEPVILPTLTSDANVVVDGTLVPKESAWLVFKVGGDVAEILVEEGEKVAEGDVLARLGDNEALIAQLRAAEAELLDAQQALEDLQDASRVDSLTTWGEILAARLAVTTAQEKLDDFDTEAYQDDLEEAMDEAHQAEYDFEQAQEDFKDYRDLPINSSAYQRHHRDLEEAEEAFHAAVQEREELEVGYEMLKLDLNLAQARLELAELQYANRAEGPDVDLVASLQAKIDAAEAQITALQAGLRDLEIRAPFGGTILDVDLMKNETVSAGRPVILLADCSQWTIETDDLTEMEVVHVEEGQAVSAVPDAMPDAVVSGRVESIDAFAHVWQGDVIYTARILLDAFDLPLRWGMTMVVTFE